MPRIPALQLRLPNRATGQALQPLSWRNSPFRRKDQLAASIEAADLPRCWGRGSCCRRPWKANSLAFQSVRGRPTRDPNGKPLARTFRKKLPLRLNPQRPDSKPLRAGAGRRVAERSRKSIRLRGLEKDVVYRQASDASPSGGCGRPPLHAVPKPAAAPALRGVRRASPPEEKCRRSARSGAEEPGADGRFRAPREGHQGRGRGAVRQGAR